MIKNARHDHTLLSIFLIFLRLGLTSFGGPVAHLGYFHHEFVQKRRWLPDQEYADLVALCQFLPGPASSQVGLALGHMRAGYGGALMAWLGFTLPSACILILLGLGLVQYADGLPNGLLSGLKLAAVAVVAHAVWSMTTKLCTDATRVTLMSVCCCAVLLLPSSSTQILCIFIGGLLGLALFRHTEHAASANVSASSQSHAFALTLLGTFFILLMVLPWLASQNQTLALFDAFYRAGALVFGGGHVVLPLLQTEVVEPGWVDADLFVAGYGATQAVPGPLFTFAAFLGTVAIVPPNAVLGGALCLVAIFVPATLLILGALPFWQSLRRNLYMRRALHGINAAVVGLLLAALYDPIWSGAVYESADFALVLLALVALAFWRLPAWLVVASCAGIATLFAQLN